MPMKKGTKIGPILKKKGPISNSDTILKRFWEEQEKGARKSKNVDIFPKILKMVKSSQEMVLLYSPKLTYGDLRVELKKRMDAGIRTYGLIKNIDMHKDIIDFGIFRESNKVHSTFILIDPKTNPKGIWLVGELTKELELDFYLELDPDQVKETWAHFTHLFWNASGKELFFGKIRDSSNKTPPQSEVTPTIYNTSRREGFDGIFSEVIEKMIIPSKIATEVEDYLVFPKELAIELKEESKDIIDLIDLNRIEVKASERFPCGYALIGKGTSADQMVFGSDLMFKMNERQAHLFNERCESTKWHFIAEKKIKDIKTGFILENDNWGKYEIRSIENNVLLKLNDAQSGNIENWQKGMPEPKIDQDKIHLAKKITYEWRILPPYLPSGAKKHRLYERWNRFNERLKKETKRTINEINNKSKSKLNRKIIAKKSRWLEWTEELGGLLNKDLAQSNSRRTVEKAVDRLIEIQDKFKNDIESLMDKKKDKKKKEKNELQDLLNISTNTSKLSDQIPNEVLPGIGILYEKKNDAYIVIKFIEEIPEALKVSKKYHAKVVTNGGK